MNTTSDLPSTKIASSDLIWIKRMPFMVRRARLWMGSLLVASDTLTLIIAFALAITVRMYIMEYVFDRLSQKPFQIKDSSLFINPQIILPAFFLFLILFYLNGLYPGNGLSPVKEMQRLTINTSIIYMGIAASTFVAKTSDEYSRLTFVLSWFLSILLLPLMRFIFRILAIDHLSWGEPIAIVGSLSNAKRLVAHLKTNAGIGLKPVFLFDKDARNEREYENVPILHDSWLYEICAVNQIECILVCDDQEHTAEEYQAFFKRVIVVKTDSFSQLIWVSVKDLYGVVGYEIKVNLNNPGPRLFKRAIDIIVASLGLLVIAPILGLLVILIHLDSKGPAFYKQIRVGRDGRRFIFFKLRTMHQDADRLLEEHLNKDPALKSEWDLYQKLQKDPRVTRVGKFLRRFSLDEIPQLLNVLVGDMSLVGPRPFFPQQEDFYGDRLWYYKRVRPGLTGMWQISGKNEKTFQERTYFDEYYVRNWSIWLDIYVLARTVPTVLLNRGDY